jgi:hypothetical protein
MWDELNVRWSIDKLTKSSISFLIAQIEVWVVSLNEISMQTRVFSILR